MVEDPEYLAVDVLNCNWMLLIELFILSCENIIALFVEFTVHTALARGLPLSKNWHPDTLPIVYWVGNVTWTSKFIAKGVTALKLNKYLEDRDFA